MVVEMYVMRPLGFIPVPTKARITGCILPEEDATPTSPPVAAEADVHTVEIYDLLRKRWMVDWYMALSDDEYATAEGLMFSAAHEEEYDPAERAYELWEDEYY